MNRMQVSLLTVWVALTSVSALVAQQAGEVRHTIVLHAARLLDIGAGKIVSPGEVLVEGERIVAAGSAVKHPAGAQVIDLGNTTYH